jgi:heme-degrading monooxygenase HmoA
MSAPEAMSGFHLAQYNVTTLRAPLDAPQSAPFREALDQINALAEAQPGFIWRATGQGFDSAEPAPDQDPLYIVNLSLWASAEALAAFAYRTQHREYVRRRGEWFEPRQGPSFVLRWIPAGTIPTNAECEARLADLAAHGPSERAFDFAARRPAPTLEFSAKSS